MPSMKEFNPIFPDPQESKNILLTSPFCSTNSYKIRLIKLDTSLCPPNTACNIFSKNSSLRTFLGADRKL